MKTVRDIAGNQRYFDLDALDGDAPAHVCVVSPPEDVTPLPPEALRLEGNAFDSLASWVRAHRILAATAIRETGLLSGARFGRVEIEAFQAAPTLRLLSKPRPSLLVADDVGLGKTIEAGLAMLELMARRRVKRILVVVPPGLVLQWRDEMREKFGLEFAVIENATGLARAQGDLPAGVSPWDALPRVLTSIDYLKKETTRHRALAKQWDLVVVDEAHALGESGTPRNPYRTQRTRLGAALKDKARGLLLLTATPHNGHAHSFRSLLELVEPSAASLHGAAADVARRVDRAMVRRMKAQIRRKRPDGGEEGMFPRRRVEGIAVTDAALGYGEILRKVSSYCSRTARDAAPTDGAELIGFAMQIVKKRALSSRRALEKTIEHRLEALKKPEAREEPPDRAEIRDLQAGLPMSESQNERTTRKVLRSSIPEDERRRKAEVRKLNDIRKLLKRAPAGDPKIAALLHELKAVNAAGEKIIVFTEYVDTLESVAAALETEPEFRERWVVLRGGLSPRQRIARQEAFERDDVAVLLATDAASEGLNLQRRCRRVIHVELPWNPNRMEQRNGRVDRYGQTRPPEIRYLFHRDSPEEEVLDTLVRKIEQMRDDRVSTADMLGLLAGPAGVEAGLVELDAEDEAVAERQRSLVHHFDDRTAEFVRTVRPLLGAGGFSSEERDRLLRLLNHAAPLVGDDLAFEELMRGLLGAQALKPTGDEFVFRVEVPVHARGPSVPPFYPRATFRRSTAVRHRADDVEFVTPAHPLALAFAEEAHRRLLQVFPEQRGLPPRRLACRHVAVTETPSALFTFFGAIRGGGDLLEEHVLAVRIGLDGSVAGDEADGLRTLDDVRDPGEPAVGAVVARFEGAFERMAASAAAEAAERLQRKATVLRRLRGDQAKLLRSELETDLRDRLGEIDAEEREAKGLVEKETRQTLLFAEEEREKQSFAGRREAALTMKEQRLDEVARFESVDEPLPPRPMGALFLVPAEPRT